MKRLIFLVFFLSVATKAFTQADTIKPFRSKKGQIYIAWGYTRAWYTRSTIHFKDFSYKYHPSTGNTQDYSFTVYDVKATDKPDFDKLPDVINITIPQFVVHGGYMFNSKWGFELNYDHTKYVVTDWQRVRVKGEIFGNPVDQDTTLNPDRFLHFEHTDGANFMLFNAVRRFTLFTPSKNFRASWVAKAGFGFVYPRTDVTMFGEHLNNRWHIAGWITGIESGLRMEYGRLGFLEFVGKGSFANYTNSLVLGAGNGLAYHHFFCAQVTLTLGLIFESKGLSYKSKKFSFN